MYPLSGSLILSIGGKVTHCSKIGIILKMALSKLRPVNLYRLSKIAETNESTTEFSKDVGLILKNM